MVNPISRFDQTVVVQVFADASDLEELVAYRDMVRELGVVVPTECHEIGPTSMMSNEEFAERFQSIKDALSGALQQEGQKTLVHINYEGEA